MKVTRFVLFNCFQKLIFLIILVSGSSISSPIHAGDSGAISGKVTSESTGFGLSGVRVEVYSSRGQSVVSSDTTDRDGLYTAAFLPDGDYYVRTRANSYYVDEIYNNQQCPAGSCTGAVPTPIRISRGNIVPRIDFALESAGAMSGAVTDADTLEPIGGVRINLYTALGDFVGNTTTSSVGGYSFTQVPVGSYRARTHDTAEHADELFDDIPCQGGTCSISAGTGISVSAGLNTPNVDFELVYGGGVTGTVFLNNRSTPVTTGRVLFFDVDGVHVATSTDLDVNGNYAVTRLAAGAYTARTQTPLGFQDELYGGIRCENGFCDVTQGDPITVVVGSVTTEIDFAILGVSTISGTVTTPAGPLEGVEVRLYRNNPSTTIPFSLSDTDITSADGSFNLGGSHASEAIVVTSNSLGFVDELYDDIPCPGSSCITLTEGHSFDLHNPGSDATANFELAMGGSISGVVTEQGTGEPIEGVEIIVYVPGTGSESKFRAASGLTDTDGNYRVEGLPSYDEFRVETYNESGFVDEVFDDRLCIPDVCDIHENLVTVVLGEDTPGVDFALTRGGRISGSVTDGSTGDPLASVEIEIDHTAGSFHQGYPTLNVVTDEAGVYVTSIIPPGDYTARTVDQDRLGYADEVWDDIPWLDIPCTGLTCDLSSASKITVEAGVDVAEIDFELFYGAIGGTVRDAITQQPVTSGVVRVTDASGTFTRQSALDSNGAYLIEGLPVRSYFVWTAVSGNYFNEIYDDLLCLNVGSCDKTVGEPVVVAGGVPATEIDFDLSPGGVISGEFIDITTGGQVTARALAYDSSGNYFKSSGWSTGSYSIEGLPADTYTVKAESVDAVGNLLYYDMPCNQGCDVTTGTPVPVAAGAVVPGINFDFLIGGHIDGRVLNEQTAAWTWTPATKIDLYDQAGSLLSKHNISVDEHDEGRYAIKGLPAGNYFVGASSQWSPLDDPSWEYFFPEVFSDVSCLPSCEFNLAFPIEVKLSEGTPINLELTPIQGIGALVSNSDNGEPVDGFLMVYDHNGAFLKSCELGVEHELGMAYPGACVVSGVVTPGTYYVRTQADGMIDQISGGVPCPQGACDVTTGAPINVTAGRVARINFSLEPESAIYSIGGTVSGLVGSGLVLQNNSVDQLTVTEDGGFVFDELLATGSSYQVTVKTQPGNPAQNCTVSNGTGTVADGDITDIEVDCTTLTEEIFINGFEE